MTYKQYWTRHRADGRKIIAERAKHHWTAVSLAAHAGLASETIRNIENERVQPRKKTLEKIAKALGVEIRELLK